MVLLSFLERHGPDPLNRQIAHIARNDEARHVAFAMAHLEAHLLLEPQLRSRLALAVEARHRALQSTAGLNEDVFDALVLLAAGHDSPNAVAKGWEHVQNPQHDMANSRHVRLARLGFTAGEAEALSSLHTRNFMQQRAHPLRHPPVWPRENGIVIAMKAGSGVPRE